MCVCVCACVSVCVCVCVCVLCGRWGGGLLVISVCHQGKVLLFNTEHINHHSILSHCVCVCLCLCVCVHLWCKESDIHCKPSDRLLPSMQTDLHKILTMKRSL